MRLSISYKWAVTLRVRNRSKRVRVNTYTNQWGCTEEDAVRFAEKTAKKRGSKFILEVLAVKRTGIAYAFDLDDRDAPFIKDPEETQRLWANDPNNPAAALIAA